MFERLLSARTRRVSGAISGQLSQALVSFTLSLLAAHALGASGLGVFALVYSAMITTTALCNGMVGDSLTVMERGRPGSGPRCSRGASITSVGTGVVTAGLFEWGGAPRRAARPSGSRWPTPRSSSRACCAGLLMAVMRFWSLVVVDLAGLVGSLVLLAAWRTHGAAHPRLPPDRAGGRPGRGPRAWPRVLLPAEERWLAPWRPAAMRRGGGLRLVAGDPAVHPAEHADPRPRDRDRGRRHGLVRPDGGGPRLHVARPAGRAGAGLLPVLVVRPDEEPPLGARWSDAPTARRW